MEIRNILSWVTYLPAAAGLILLLFPKPAEKAAKVFAFLASVWVFVLSLHLPVHFNRTIGGMQYEESTAWIQTAAFRVQHHLGLDGISLFLVCS